MTLFDVADEALRALSMDRRRAVLSSIGVVVGIATVVAALAIGEGARRAAIDEIGALGIDNLFVQSRTLQRGDVDRIARHVPGTRAAALSLKLSTNVRSESTAAQVPVIAAAPAFGTIANLHLTAGRWLVDADMLARRRVAVIGDEQVATFFRQGSAIGRSIWLACDWYEVVGIVVSSGVFVPLTTAEASWSITMRAEAVRELAVRVATNDVLPAAELVRHLLNATAGADTTVVVPRELLDGRLRAQRTFTVVLIAIGALALMISGMGIMNVMLASVAERTAELGVRRAVGAPRRAILLQLTAESTLLCLLGAVVGTPLGALFAGAVAWFAAWPIAISLPGIVLAFVSAGVTGISSGVYPARAAARIAPVDAMRAM